MLRRDQIWPLILLVLIVIGIVSSIRSLIIPAIIVGIVIFLYFFPPPKWRWYLARFNNRMRSRQSQAYGRNSRKPGSTKTRHVKLRVIKGNKSDESNEPPRYH